MRVLETERRRVAEAPGELELRVAEDDALTEG